MYLESLSYIACGLSSGDIIVGLVHHFLTHTLFKCTGKIFPSLLPTFFNVHVLIKSCTGVLLLSAARQRVLAVSFRH